MHEVQYHGGAYQKADAYLEWCYERAFLTGEQENKLLQVIDFLATRGYTYSDRISRWGSLHAVAASITGPDGKAHTFGFRETWIGTIWRGSILYRLAEIAGHYDSPDRYWRPGAQGYPTFDNPYYLEWRREEARRLDRADPERWSW